MDALPDDTSASVRPESPLRWAVVRANTLRAAPRLILAILAVALALRLYGITWDNGHFFHPDERSIYMRSDCMYRVLTEAPGYRTCTADAPFEDTVPGWPGPVEFLDADKSPLNPHWFPLGTMLIYALVAIKLVMAPMMTMGLGDLAIAGRTLAALADVGTVFMVYLLGRRFFGRSAGTLAAVLVTFAVVHVQTSHFYRPEPFTNLFTLASFWFMLNVLDRNWWRDSAFLGLFLGLAFATKVSVLPILLPVATLYGYRFLQARRQENHAERSADVEAVALRLLTTGSVAAAVYLLVTPYALLDFPEFLEWNLRELDIVRNAGMVPYTVQYVDTPNLLYELRQTTVWGLGIPLGLLAWGGFVTAVVANVRRPVLGQILVLLWAVPLVVTVTTVEVKFLRYTFPLMPVFILFGSGMALYGARRLGRIAPQGRKIALGLLLVVVAATVFYGLAFETIYARPHPATQASRWINEYIPAGASILTDNHWDEGIPNLGGYSISQLPMFDGDTEGKISSVSAKLASADYLVFYSKRTYGAISRVPERYPYSSAYYRALFSGKLGYRLAKDFSRYPGLAGVAFADDSFRRAGLPVPPGLEARNNAPVTLNLGYADNDAVDYDHPLVLVFRNNEKLGAEELRQRILTSSSGGADSEPPMETLLTPREVDRQRSGGTWSALFNAGDIANRIPVVVWLLGAELAFIVVLPLGYVIFGGLYDRGYLLTKPLALLLVGYVPWLLAAAKLVPFDRLAIGTGVVLIALVSGALVVRKRSEMWAFLRTRWRTLALEESLFLVAFLVFVAIRWANPDLWHPFRGGEKPMDFAYLNAIIRSSTIPPFDPWFADGALNYYYFGQFIVAVLIKATRILPEVAYNLAIPLMFALTVGGAFSIVYNLTHALRAHSQRPAGPGWGPAAAGIAGVLLVTVLGNMGSLVQVALNAWKATTTDASFPRFDFWAPSRMMPDEIAINEFPSWTFLFADLHAHVIAIPFTLLAIGLGLSLVRTGALSGIHWRLWAPPAGGLALAVGSLAAINTWDYPSYVLLGIGAVALGCFAAYQQSPLAEGALGERGHRSSPYGGAEPEPGGHTEPGRTQRLIPATRFGPMIKAALPRAMVFVSLSYLLFLPFHLRNVTFGVGLHASGLQTHILHYLGIHGLFLFIVLSFLVYETRGPLKGMLGPLRALVNSHAQQIVAEAPSTLPVNRLVLALVILFGMTLAYTAAAGYITVAFLFPLVAVTLLVGVRHVVVGTKEAPYHLYLLMLAAGALGIGITVDLVTVDNDIDRMNTVFKLGLEAWILFALFSAAALWYLLTRHISFRGAFLLKGAWLGALAFLVTAAAIFPVLGTPARLSDRFNTDFTGLDGMQFMKTATYPDENGPIELRWDRDGIRWLRENVNGSPVVAEGNTDPHNYRWGSRISIYTGLPTIIGWGWHQTQQRLGEQAAVHRRLGDVRTLFTTRDHRRASDILRHYNVEYIYVGRLERLYYPPEGLAKFDAMGDLGVRLAYTNPQVKIYRVIEGANDVAPATPP